MKKPLVLIVLDGWGVHPGTPYNAIEQAQTPQWDSWWKTMPHGLLSASGEAVGLPAGQMGNSEVGHMHIGLGRVIPQDLTRINQAIATGEFEKNPVFLSFLQQVKAGGHLHIMGLLSPGGVHSHEDQLFAFLKLCEKVGVRGIHLHLFLDGRDSPPQSALASLEKLETVLKSTGTGHIASLCGRYFAMDRDTRWDRVQAAYRLMVEGVADCTAEDAASALRASYASGRDDEFVLPTLIGKAQPIQTGDSVFLFNFRADRVRQLMQALTQPDFAAFKRSINPQLKQLLTMTQVDVRLPAQVAYPQLSVAQTLGEVLAEHHLTQLRIAETEKYAHVTFFFDGGVDHVYPGEDRVLIPSPNVATYDLQPEMSAAQITDHVVQAVHERKYDVIICNYANADMVGHTGNLNATMQAIYCLDECLKRIGDALWETEGYLLITADHGNAELMFDETIGQPHTAHTTYPVPFLFVGKGWRYAAQAGSLADIAPTVLALLGIEAPREMTGHSLLKLEKE